VEPVDALIITALKEEFDATQNVGMSGVGRDPGIETWVEHDRATNSPYLLGSYILADDSRITVALARPTRMAVSATSPTAASLAERLNPTCLAMSGVCAGNPARVALGDVVVAELAYGYGEGKVSGDSFAGDHRQIPLADAWVREAQELTTTDLPSFAEPDADVTRLWLLESLFLDVDPGSHRARSRYAPGDLWSNAVTSLENDGLVVRADDAVLSLTPKGISYVKAIMYNDVDGPRRLPFSVTVGPMASGEAVVKDGGIWGRLREFGMRTVTALDMEASGIANTAHRLDIPHWIVAKGVVDHADRNKGDRYRHLAAHASAEVLFRMLSLRLAGSSSDRPAAGKVSRLKRVYIIGGVTQETDYPTYESSQLAHVCTRLGETVARAGAELIVCSPFPDSADIHATHGYVRADVGGTVHFHLPRDPRVAEKQAELLTMLGSGTRTRVQNWYYPAPDDENSWTQAWLLCQLQALEQADAVIAIGGRLSSSANTLLHIAEARKKVLVPFDFIGGAARRAYLRRNWSALYPWLDGHDLRHEDSVGRAMDIAERMATQEMRGERGHSWPPRSVFVSRAHEDSEFAVELGRRLERNGVCVIFGDEQIRGDRMVQPAIDDAIVTADLFIALWSRSYALSPFCYDELELADRRHRAGGLHIRVVNLDGSDIVPGMARGLPRIIARTPQAMGDVVDEILTTAHE